MNYVCSTCSSTFSSLDFAILLNRDSGLMCCDQCGTEVLEQFGTDGQTGNADDRRKRREVRCGVFWVLLIRHVLLFYPFIQPLDQEADETVHLAIGVATEISCTPKRLLDISERRHALKHITK